MKLLLAMVLAVLNLAGCRPVVAEPAARPVEVPVVRVETVNQEVNQDAEKRQDAGDAIGGEPQESGGDRVETGVQPTDRDSVELPAVVGDERPGAAVAEVPRRLLYFTADYCVPCQRNKPALREIKRLYLPEYERIQVVDCTTYNKLQATWKIEALPTYIVVEGDKEVSREVGGHRTVEQFRAYLRSASGSLPQAGPTPSGEAAAAHGARGGAGGSSPPASPFVRVKTGNRYASGVVISCDLRTRILTASHVIHAGWPWSVNGHAAELIEDDEANDLAIIEIDAAGFKAVPLAQVPPAEGAACVAHGFPAGQTVIRLRPVTLSLRSGGGNAVGYYTSRPGFVPGESGGAVVNASNELVGIVSGTDMRSGTGVVVDLPSIRGIVQRAK